MSERNEAYHFPKCPFCDGEPELVATYLDRIKYKCAECCYYCGPEVINTGDFDETCSVAAQEWTHQVENESQSTITRKLGRVFYVLDVDVYNHIRLIRILREESGKLK